MTALSVQPGDANAELRRSQYEQAARASDRKDGSKSIQSVDRALSIIEALSLSNSPLMLSEISKLVDLNISTCHHLVKTLVSRGYVVNSGRGRGYSLSSKLESLSRRSAREFNLVEFVTPALRELNDDIRECVQLAVLRGSILVTHVRLASQMPSHADASGTPKLHAAHAVALGKAILAWLPEAELARVVADNGLASFTSSTITSLSVLVEELRLVRRSGFAIEDGEFHPEVVGFGAAVRDTSGAVVGSIGITVPRRRATEAYRTYIAQAVMKSAKDISGRMPAGCFT
ncbi:IclR family transcriptional regulator [Pelagibacterium lacus]|uniref:IclR family transcriptional regulator n=1 Tax=Pelagibacterium lacus TaxID=2282655 RepID=A0A369W280_9HYPH|nr:IclR family transcriptional regulator [Pelagibacterium lacus]RDE08473.1 IclR family transcriptional regulator [Pelagibacterium lacus]